MSKNIGARFHTLQLAGFAKNVIQLSTSVMAGKHKDLPRSSFRDRVVLYTTPTVTSVLMAIVFWRLSFYQAQVRELQQHVKLSDATANLKHSENSKYIDSPVEKLLSRYARDTGNDKGTDSLQTLNDYFLRIAEQQVTTF